MTKWFRYENAVKAKERAEKYGKKKRIVRTTSYHKLFRERRPAWKLVDVK